MRAIWMTLYQNMLIFYAVMATLCAFYHLVPDQRNPYRSPDGDRFDRCDLAVQLPRCPDALIVLIPDNLLVT